jgi:hypothetical protein
MLLSPTEGLNADRRWCYSYFVIVSWVWASQVHYDIRYQGEDIFHRLCKGLQITCFVYIGAASGSWDPGYILDPVYAKSSLSKKDVSRYRQYPSRLLCV